MVADPNNIKFFADSIGKLGEAGIISYELLLETISEADALDTASYLHHSDIDEEVASSLRTGLRIGFNEIREINQSITTYSTVIKRLNDYIGDKENVRFNKFLSQHSLKVHDRFADMADSLNIFIDRENVT